MFAIISEWFKAILTCVITPQLQVSTPPDSNKSTDEARCGARGCPRAEELSKMFPTPPSMEAHAQASPGFSLPDDATPRHLAPAGSPPPDNAIEVCETSLY